MNELTITTPVVANSITKLPVLCTTGFEMGLTPYRSQSIVRGYDVQFSKGKYLFDSIEDLGAAIKATIGNTEYYFDDTLRDCLTIN